VGVYRWNTGARNCNDWHGDVLGMAQTKSFSTCTGFYLDAVGNDYCLVFRKLNIKKSM